MGTFSCTPIEPDVAVNGTDDVLLPLAVTARPRQPDRLSADERRDCAGIDARDLREACATANVRVVLLARLAHASTSAGAGGSSCGRVAQGRQIARVAPMMGAQRVTLDDQIATRDLLLRDDLVVTRLRFRGVTMVLVPTSNSRFACARFSDTARLLASDRTQRVLRRKHVEVRLRDPQDQSPAAAWKKVAFSGGTVSLADPTHPSFAAVDRIGHRDGRPP